MSYPPPWILDTQQLRSLQGVIMNAFAGVYKSVGDLALLRGLDPGLHHRLAADACVLSVARGQTVFRQGEPCRGLHVVMDGQVKLVAQAGNGQEKVFDVIGPDTTLGEAALFLDTPHQVTAEAVVDTRLLHLARKPLFRELAADGLFAMRVIEGLARQINRHTEDLKSYMLLSGTQRVVCFLLQELPDDFPESGEVAVTLPTRKGIIASKLNLTHEHFSRILHDLMSAELIEVSGAQVRIPDVGRMRTSLMA